jgi:hypothetical protein
MSVYEGGVDVAQALPPAEMIRPHELDRLVIAAELR